jgi:hypothetical protein
MASLIDLSRKGNGITTVGGKAFPTNSPAAEIATVKNAMVQRGILPQSSTPVGGDGADVTLDVLSALNVSVDYSTNRRFSLIQTETDTEVIENPNIIDTVKWEETMNVNILTTTSFPSTTDNFFTLDAGPDEAVKRQREKTEKTKKQKDSKNLVNLASNLINYNLIDAKRGTLPQFKL